MEIGLYFKMGITHITDPAGYDHMLFLLALCASYTLRNWKHLAWLVTAFTVGHATTLALAAWEVFPVNRPLVEVLIAVSIAVTALYNLIWNGFNRDLARMRTPAGWPLYAVALGFGLIHGFGFSGLFKALVGSSEEVIVPLLGFNLGIETGQLGVVLLILAVQWLVMRLARMRGFTWTMGASALALVISGWMIWERIPALYA